MLFNARCWTPPAAALATVTILLSGCAGVGSDRYALVCPMVVEYSRAEQGKLANEMAALAKGALIIDWLADYEVLRAQVRACAR